MNKMPCLADTLITSERKQYVPSMSELRASPFSNMDSLMNAIEAEIKVSDAMIKMQEAGALLADAHALYTADAFVDAIGLLADQVSDLNPVRDRLKEITESDPGAIR